MLHCFDFSVERRLNVHNKRLPLRFLFGTRDTRIQTNKVNGVRRPTPANQPSRAQNIKPNNKLGCVLLSLVQSSRTPNNRQFAGCLCFIRANFSSCLLRDVTSQLLDPDVTNFRWRHHRQLSPTFESCIISIPEVTSHLVAPTFFERTRLVATTDPFLRRLVALATSAPTLGFRSAWHHRWASTVRGLNGATSFHRAASVSEYFDSQQPPITKSHSNTHLPPPRLLTFLMNWIRSQVFQNS